MNLFFSQLTESLSISWGAIRQNKMRAALTTFSIVIGIVSVTLMGTAIEGLNRAFNESIAGIGSDVLYVQKWPWGGGGDWWVIRNRPNITMEHLKAIQRQAHLVRSVSPAVGTRRDVTFRGKIIEDVVIIGTNAAFAETGNAGLSLGRFMTPLEEEGGRPVCVIGSDVSENLFARESPLGKSIKLGNRPYRVLGVIEKKGNMLGIESLDNRIYVPIKRYFKEFQSSRGSGISIMVKASSIEGLEETKEEVRDILRRARRLPPKKADDFAINQQDLLIQSFNAIEAVIATVGLFITGLSLFVGGIGIMNIMFVSVTERTKEIGIRKAIGAPKRAILVQFLIESIFICVAGGIIGIVVAFPLSLIVNTVLPTAMPLNIALIALLVSLFVGVVSGFLPAYRASRMDPVDALRYE